MGATLSLPPGAPLWPPQLCSAVQYVQDPFIRSQRAAPVAAGVVVVYQFDVPRRRRTHARKNTRVAFVEDKERCGAGCVPLRR